MRRVLLATALLVLSAQAVAALATPVRSRAAAVTVTMTERRCSLSPRTVRQGPVTFRIVNRGRRARVFTIAGKRTRPVAAGRNATLRVSFSRAGRYRYACASRAGTIRGVLVVAAPPPGASGPCGTSTAGRAVYDHVVWIVMENRAYGQIIGSTSAPYVNQLAHRCGLATNFHAETHPSLPNYIAMTSGDTQGIHDDAGPSSHPLQVASIFSQLGSGWRALQESMSSNCSLSNSGRYAVRHNPPAYYVNVRSQCLRQDVPLADPPDLSARFTFITPDLCNDMHDCSAETGDRWLAKWLPKIFASAEYRSGSTAVFVTWDEDDRGSDNHIATVVMSPSTPAGTTSSAAFDHYSLLRTTEELLGLGFLGKAASAGSMRAAFHL